MNTQYVLEHINVFVLLLAIFKSYPVTDHRYKMGCLVT